MMTNKAFQLEDYVSENGLYPAAVGSEYEVMNNRFWVRDNYYMYLASNKETKNKILSAFQKIIDNQAGHGKFENTPSLDKEYLHPIYKADLSEIDEVWGFIQNDSAGNMLEIFSENKDEWHAGMVLNYLDKINYWNSKGFGFWEEGPKEVRASSLAACLRGIESFQENFYENKKTKKLLDKGYKQLLKTLEFGETKTRNEDLAMISLIYPGKLNEKIITSEIKNDIIRKVQTLEGRWGIKRYFGDQWNGKENILEPGKEMQWTMGLPWMYLATGEKEYLTRSKKIKDKFGFLPEGIVDGKAGHTSFLLWTEAMYKLAKEKAFEEY